MHEQSTLLIYKARSRLGAAAIGIGVAAHERKRCWRVARTRSNGTPFHAGRGPRVPAIRRADRPRRASFRTRRACVHDMRGQVGSGKLGEMRSLAAGRRAGTSTRMHSPRRARCRKLRPAPAREPPLGNRARRRMERPVADHPRGAKRSACPCAASRARHSHRARYEGYYAQTKWSLRCGRARAEMLGDRRGRGRSHSGRKTAPRLAATAASTASCAVEIAQHPWTHLARRR